MDKEELRPATVVAGSELEREAVALVKLYGSWLPAPAKDFLRKLAAYLAWETLKGTLK